MSTAWQFRFKRLRGVLKVLFKSRMATLGVIILGLFIFSALAAPILTPYDPETSQVAGPLAHPVWFTYFSEGARLSQNLNLESQPTFTSDPFNDQWTFTSSDNNLGASFFPGFSSGGVSTGSRGSIRIVLDRGSSTTAGVYTAKLERPFYWPYSSSPASFTGSLSIQTPNASSVQPVYTTVYLKNIDNGQVYNLTDNAVGRNLSWGQYPLNASQTGCWLAGQSSTQSCWRSPSDIGGDATKTVLRSNILNLSPSDEIFSAPGHFVYGVVIGITNAQMGNGPLNVFVDQANLQLYGTAWGLLGTDYQGRDVFTQVIYGARISLMVGLLSAAIGIVVGLIVGLAAGYMGKFVDEALMRFTDMLLVLPTLPLIIILVAVTAGRSTIFVLITIIGLLGWMGFARVVRSQVLTLKERPYVEAAKASGGGVSYILGKHIIPNIIGLIYVNLALAVPGAILSEAALSFLGL